MLLLELDLFTPLLDLLELLLLRVELFDLGEVLCDLCWKLLFLSLRLRIFVLVLPELLVLVSLELVLTLEFDLLLGVLSVVVPLVVVPLVVVARPFEVFTFLLLSVVALAWL